ncbi:oxidoreductase [candidate division KSB1 bacterium]|nr:oxidoreductase [candidate division KSB1 bacterium]
MQKVFAILLVSLLLLSGCAEQKGDEMNFTGAPNEVKIMTLDPGHFHAALVHKKMYEQVDPTIHIYAPDGQDVEDHINRIEGFNNRADNPTDWNLEVYRGPDFLEKMTSEKPGNVMVTAGNNRKKTEYIKTTVDAGINVLSDKPMCINKEGFELLKQAFESAEANNVLLYDIMTERYEITTMMQRELSMVPEVFGQLVKGSVEDPAVTKESVHHFFKYVSGSPLKRPPWYFDVNQQGEGIVDVTTHLVDLIQWECFPNQIIDYTSDIEMVSSKRWPTVITPEQYAKVTGLESWPEYLKKDVREDGNLYAYSNGEMNYTLNGVHAKVSVIWNYQAPEGAGDTHFSIMRGSKANLIIRQGREQNYRPELYVEPVEGASTVASLEGPLQKAIEALQVTYPGIGVDKQNGRYHVILPDKYRVGHEAHFGQVMDKYLGFLVTGELPEWEVPNMIAKYYTNIQALEMAATVE